MALNEDTSILLAVTEPDANSLDVIVFDAISLAVIVPDAILLAVIASLAMLFATIVQVAISAQVVNEFWSAHPKALNVTCFQLLGNAAHIIILFSHTAFIALVVDDTVPVVVSTYI
jgi:hypothetical protein